jgi:branched-chain amino acid transport system substrate-binding protein
MRKFGPWGSAMLAFGLALSVASCGGSTAPASSPSRSATPSSAAAKNSPYVVHVVLGLTGQAATLAQAEKTSLELFVKRYNQHGGLDGHPVQLSIQDDENNPKVSVPLMQQLFAQHVPFVIGPTLGEAAAPDAAIFAKGPTVEYALTPAFPPPAFGSYVFSAAMSFGSAAQATLNYIESKGWTRVAFLNSTDTTGKTADMAFETALKLPQYHNLHVVQWQHFSVNAVSVATQMSVISQAHPQVLVSFATGTPLGLVLQGIANTGFKAPVITDDGNMTYAEFDQFHDIPPGGLFVASGAWNAASVLPPGPEKTADETFLQTMKAGHVRPDLGDAIPWDVITLLLDAVKHYGINATGPQIHQYLEQLTNFPGVMGVFDFTRNTPDARQRGLSTSSAYIYQWMPQQQQWVPVSKAGGAALSSQG